MPNDELYGAFKGLTYGLAQVCSGTDNAGAKTKGFKDVYNYIMSDSDHQRQAQFLIMLPETLSEKQCRILLDGMAKEYQGCDGWLAYVSRECE